jgi:hypothetical protein
VGPARSPSTARSVGEFRNRIRVLDWHLIDGWINVNRGRSPEHILTADRRDDLVSAASPPVCPFPWVPTMKCSLLTLNGLPRCNRCRSKGLHKRP